MSTHPTSQTSGLDDKESFALGQAHDICAACFEMELKVRDGDANEFLWRTGRLRAGRSRVLLERETTAQCLAEDSHLHRRIRSRSAFDLEIRPGRQANLHRLSSHRNILADRRRRVVQLHAEHTVEFHRARNVQDRAHVELTRETRVA